MLHVRARIRLAAKEPGHVCVYRRSLSRDQQVNCDCHIRHGIPLQDLMQTLNSICAVNLHSVLPPPVEKWEGTVVMVTQHHLLHVLLPDRENAFFSGREVATAGHGQWERRGVGECGGSIAPEA